MSQPGLGDEVVTDGAQETTRPLRLAFGASLVRVVVSVSALILLVSLSLPIVPDREVGFWDAARKALQVESTQSVAAWWSTVLPVLVGLAALTRAASWRRAEAVARLRRGGTAWAVIAAVLFWTSVDHQITFHQTVSRLLGATGAGPLGSHPVELALLAVSVAAGVPVWLAGDRDLRRWLALAGVATVIGQVLDWAVQPTATRYEMVGVLEVALGWAGLVALLMAAVGPLGVRARGAFLDTDD